MRDELIPGFEETFIFIGVEKSRFFLTNACYAKFRNFFGILPNTELFVPELEEETDG